VASVVVVGANGFIGSHLVDALVSEGHEVTAFDRFSSIEPTFTTRSVRLLQGEFLSRADLESAVAGQEYVFHVLSTTTPASSESDPTLDIRTNVAQTVELLESSAAAGVRKFYFASTGGAIYGDQGKAEYSESDRALPVSPYGIGKLAIEHYLRYFKATHGLDSIALRISNPYGPRQRPGRKQGLIPISLRRMLKGEAVTRFGDGSMVRDYLYVEDLARMLAPLVGRETEFSLYNVGSGIGYSVNEVLATLAKVSGVDVDVVERPVPPTFVQRVVLDTSRFMGEFGAPHLTSLEQGARLTLEEIGGPDYGD